MRYLTDVATWWDAQHKEAEISLAQFVERNPNQFAIILATGVHTSMVLGSGMVDVLRIGDGLAKRTLSGTVQDGLRLAGIVGPAGKALQLLKSRAHMKIAKAILDPGGPICSWVNSTKALALTEFKSNGKMFLAVLAKRYKATEFIPRAAVQLTNVYGKFVGPHGMATLAMEALGVVASTPSH